MSGDSALFYLQSETLLIIFHYYSSVFEILVLIEVHPVLEICLP